MDFSHLNLTGTKNVSNELIVCLLNKEQPFKKFSNNFDKLSLDCVLIHSKLHTEDDDSEEYNKVHFENNK